jgi:hypothetical protein
LVRVGVRVLLPQNPVFMVITGYVVRVVRVTPII